MYQIRSGMFDWQPSDLLLDITDGLRALRAKGYHFVYPRDTEDSVGMVTGVRTHHQLIDIIQLYGEDDAEAVRIPADEVDIMFPRRILWRTSGDAQQVIDSVLKLHDTETASSTRLLRLS